MLNTALMLVCSTLLRLFPRNDGVPFSCVGVVMPRTELRHGNSHSKAAVWNPSLRTAVTK
jgi:hypothetical protein